MEDLINSVLLANEGGRQHFASMLLLLDPVDLKRCRLVCCMHVEMSDDTEDADGDEDENNDECMPYAIRSAPCGTS